MSNTIGTLLKILVHGEIHIEEIAKYIKLDLNSIDRNIHNLNDYLKEKGMNQVKRKKNIYYFDRENLGTAEIFSKLDILSSEERQNLLCIRFLLDEYINLETERKKIDVSRTTIIKDFKEVKSYLKEYGIKTVSKSSRGIFLDVGDDEVIRKILCEKLIKLFLERGELTYHRLQILKELNILDEKKYLKIYKKINDELGLDTSSLTFYAMYSALLIERYKKIEFEYKESKKEIIKDEFEAILKIVDKYMPETATKYYKEFVATTFYNAKMKYFFKNLTQERHIKFCEEISKRFKFNKKEREEFFRYIQKFFYIGCLNKKFEFLWIRTSLTGKANEKMIEIVEESLKESGVEFLYADILRVTSHIITFLVRKQMNKKLKIVCVYRGVNAKDEEIVKKYISLMYPKVQFDFEPLLYFRLKDEDEIDSYDLIISDTDNYSRNNLKKVCSFSIENLEGAFREYVLEKKLYFF